MLSLNQIVLVGKVVEHVKMKETHTGVNYATLVLEVTRPFKNSNGIYETDRFNITLWKAIAEMANDITQVGDTLAIKGRLQTYQIEKDSQIFYNYDIIAEQISFQTAKL